MCNVLHWGGFTREAVASLTIFMAKTRLWNNEMNRTYLGAEVCVYIQVSGSAFFIIIISKMNQGDGVFSLSSPIQRHSALLAVSSDSGADNSFKKKWNYILLPFSLGRFSKLGFKMQKHCKNELKCKNCHSQEACTILILNIIRIIIKKKNILCLMIFFQEGRWNG